MPRLRGRGGNIGRRTWRSQLLQKRRLNRSAEKNENVTNQAAVRRADESQEQRNKRLRAKAMQQRLARQQVTDTVRMGEQQCLQVTGQRLPAAGNSHDYCGEIDVELQLNEENENCELEKQASLLSANGSNCIRMNSPSLLDIKIEEVDISNFLSYNCGDCIIKNEFEWFNDEGEAIRMRENEHFLLENRDTMRMKIDSLPERILHENGEIMEGSNLIDVYCKYCEDNVLSESLTSHLNEYHKDVKNKKKIQKHVNCRFCGMDMYLINLARHLEERHYEETDVQKILIHPKNSRERRHELSRFRNSTNIGPFVNSEIRYRRSRIGKYESEKYSRCVYCKTLYSNLKNHRNFCYHPKERSKAKKQQEESKLLPNFQSKVQCGEEYDTLISKLNVNNQVFHLMKCDLISLEAKRDVVIVHVGEHYLNNEKDTHVKHTVINKMRELSCLLIAYRSLVKEKNLSVIDIIDPKNFNNVVTTVKTIAGYDCNMKRFDCPNLAKNICDSLKLACSLLINLILKDNFVRAMRVNKMDWMREVNIFKNLLETQWNAELSLSDDIELSENINKQPSLTQIPIASKQDLSKPINVQIPYSLFHLAVHLKHFHEEVLRIAFQCQQELFTEPKNDDAYRLLVQSCLALLYTSNMRNVKDIQYITIKHYLNDNVRDFENYISNVERLLSTKHKCISISKEEDENVLILIPYIIERFISVLLKHRSKYMDEDNKYLFAVPGSDTMWGESEVAIRNLCQIIKLEEKSIGNDRYRKYTAVIMGILNLSQVELQQLGHYMRTLLESEHNFFELPLDACQLAKLARLLGMMEEGSILSRYKRKCLAEINIDPNNEFASHDGEGEMEEIIINHIEYVDVEDNCTDENNEQYLENVNETVEISRLTKNDSPTRNNYENDQTQDNNKTASLTTLETFCDKPARDKLQKTSSGTGNKRGWKKEEIELIEKEYRYFIESGVYPSGKQMNKFLIENNMTKTVPILRSKIQHLIKIKNKL